MSVQGHHNHCQVCLILSPQGVGRALVLAAILFQSAAWAVTIETVAVGNPGNPGETQSHGTYGAVPYHYQIGKYEVSRNQYVEFLNSVDPTGENLLALFRHSGIVLNTAAADGAKYSVAQIHYGNIPISFVSWYDCVRFVNWLHNGQGAGSTEDGAYTLVGGTPIPSNALSITRNPGARWFLPTEDEWYKAAYHWNDGVTGNYWEYPTSSDTVPNNNPPMDDTGNSANYDRRNIYEVGAYTLSGSPYGTFDQAGNLWEWNESLVGSSSRALRGGSFYNDSSFLAASVRQSSNPSKEYRNAGFRVARIPEPSAIWLLTLGVIAFCGVRDANRA